MKIHLHFFIEEIMKKILLIAGSVFLLFLGGYYYHVQVGNSLYDMQKDRAAGSHYPVTIRNSDSAGNPAEQVFTEKPRRVVTHELNTFETLICLGQGDTVIGTSINTGGTAWKRMEKMYSEEIKKVKIINRYHPDAETVVAANPDLIIGWKSTFASVLKKPTAWWNERGVRTYVVSTSNHLHDKGRIEDECRYLDDMGQIFDVREKTDRMIREIHDELSRTQKLVKGRASQAVMVVEPEGKAFYNYDNGWVVGDMVEQLGGYMPAGERRIGYEDLISYNPDVLFVVYFNEEQRLQIIEMFRRAEFSSLKSVKNQRVYPIPFDHMYTPAIKTIDGLRMIRDGLYPDLAKKEGEKE